MADKKKVYDDLIIINLYVVVSFHLLRSKQQYESNMSGPLAEQLGTARRFRPSLLFSLCCTVVRSNDKHILTNHITALKSLLYCSAVHWLKDV